MFRHRPGFCKPGSAGGADVRCPRQTSVLRVPLVETLEHVATDSYRARRCFQVVRTEPSDAWRTRSGVPVRSTLHTPFGVRCCQR